MLTKRQQHSITDTVLACATITQLSALMVKGTNKKAGDLKILTGDNGELEYDLLDHARSLNLIIRRIETPGGPELSVDLLINNWPDLKVEDQTALFDVRDALQQTLTKNVVL